MQNGWLDTYRAANDKTLRKSIGLQSDARLGYPSYGKIVNSYKAVCKTCPEEMTSYKALRKEAREIRKRYTATLSKKSWTYYIKRMSYHIVIARRRGIADKDIFRVNRYAYRYFPQDLLDRKFEQQRALRQLGEVSDKIANVEERIFTLMGVPAEFRSLSADGDKSIAEIRRELTSRRKLKNSAEESQDTA